MKKLVAVLTTIAAVLALASCGSTKVEPIEGWEEMVVPAGESTIIENFEHDVNWSATAGTSATKVAASKKWKWDGKKSLACEFTAIEENGKAGYECSVLSKTDWSGNSCLVIKVNNPNAFDLYLSVSTEATGDKGTTVNISDALRCPPGVHTMVFDISKFKDQKATTKLYLFQNGKADEGKFLIDQVRLISGTPDSVNEK